MERPQTPERAYSQPTYTASITPQLPGGYGYPPQAYSAPAPAPYGFAPPVLTPLPNTRRRRPRRRRQRSPNSRSGSSTKSSETLTRTTSATTAALNDYEAQWIAMATTRKMSVDNAEGLLEAVRGHATKPTRASCGGTRKRSTTA